MTESGQPVPQRIGDAERDRAAELLREHMAQGRLSAEEFDQRLDVALQAKTSGDLDPLFTDLPGPRPGQAVATTPTYATPPWQQPQTPVPAAATPSAVAPERNAFLVGLTAVMWPVTILLLTFVIGWDYWWLIFVPVLISMVLGKSESDRERERRHIERDQARLDRRRRSIGD